MKENTHETDLEALNAGIAKSREEIGALLADLKKLSVLRNDKAFVDIVRSKEGPAEGGWTGFKHKLDEAGARGEKAAKGLADEIKRHPLIAGATAFGLGFVIATVLFKRSKRDSGQ